ncbi:hypothetical protein LJR234_000359 [Mesorhizobium amorphae]|uniref:hypothetical protein n=1 Tax=Mesorhizobium amorphae TaxID=71433 RepID=UPI003ECFAAFC
MTTVVKVHVGGNYLATVQHIVDGKGEGEPVQVKPQEEKYFTVHHGKANSFEITEEYLGDKG